MWWLMLVLFVEGGRGLWKIYLVRCIGVFGSLEVVEKVEMWRVFFCGLGSGVEWGKCWVRG